MLLGVLRCVINLFEGILDTYRHCSYFIFEQLSAYPDGGLGKRKELKSRVCLVWKPKLNAQRGLLVLSGAI